MSTKHIATANILYTIDCGHGLQIRAIVVNNYAVNSSLSSAGIKS